MIDSVSRAAREKRGGRASKSLRTCSWFAGFVRSCTPLATSSTRIPEESGEYFACRRPITSCASAFETPPSNCRTFSKEIGSAETRSRLSRIEAARARITPDCSSSGSASGFRSSSTEIGSSPGGSLDVGLVGFSSILALPYGGHDADQPQRVGLVQADRLEPDQLQDAQEKGYDFVARLALLHEGFEPQRPLLLQAVQEEGDGVG